MSTRTRRHTSIPEPATGGTAPIEAPVTGANSDAIADLGAAGSIVGGPHPGSGSGSRSILADAALAGQAQPQAAAQKPFLRRGAAGQMETLAQVMSDGRALLDANGVSGDVERRVASTVPQELSANDARRGLGYTFLKQAKGLQAALKGVDPNDAAAMAKATAKLTEEQKFLYARTQAGALDLSQLPSDLSKTPEDLRDQVTEAGISLRTSQYGEMSDLQRKAAATPKDMTKEDKARLSTLQGIGGLGMRYNGYDPTMGDLSGMSAGRFGEIFAEGNTRFEPVQYRKLRDSYAKNLKAHGAAVDAHAEDPTKKAPPDTVAASAGIGDFDVNPTGQGRLAQNADLLADIATSYGPGQIMGGYADQPYWKGRSKAERLPALTQPDGSQHTTTLDELKASGTRMEPTVDDIAPMLGLVKMKGIDLGGSPTIPQWISAYNGNPNPTQRAQYTNSLATNGPLYDTAKAALPKPATGGAPTGPATTDP